MNLAQSTAANRSFSRFALPNRTDGLFLLIAWLLVSSPISGWIYAFLIDEHFYDYAIVALLPWGLSCLGCAMGLGSALGWAQTSGRRFKWLFWSCVVSLFLCCASFAFEKGIRLDDFANVSLGMDDFSEAYLYPAPFLIFDFLPPYVAWPVVWFAVFLISWLSTLSLRLAPKFFKAVGSRLRITRTKMLIGFAVFLFAVGSAQNIFYNPNSEGLFLLWIVQAAIWSTIFVVSFLWPSWVWSRPGKRIQKTVILLACAALTVVVYYFVNPFPFIESLICAVGVALLWICFLGTTYLVSKKQLELDLVPSRLLPPVYPSLWTTAPLVLLIVFVGGAFVVNYRYDLRMLIYPEFTLYQKLEMGHYSRRINRESAGQIKIEIIRSEFYYDCVFDETTDANIFERLQSDIPLHANIKNMQPQINTKPIRGHFSKHIMLEGGELTRQQLEDCLYDAAWVSLADVAVSTVGEPIDLMNTQNLHLMSVTSTGIASVLDAINSPGSLSQIRISSTVNERDWNAVVRCSQKIPVYIDGGLSSEILKLVDHKLPLDNVMLNISQNIELSPDLFEFVLANDITLNFEHGLVFDHKTFWDLVFAKPREINFSIHAAVQSGFEVAKWLTYEETAEDYHWVFQTDEHASITGLFLPVGLMFTELEELTELRTLSFDPAWILRDPNYFSWFPSQYRSVDFSRLTNLERIYFPKHFNGQLLNNLDLEMFSSLPKLEHLQIAITSNFDVVNGFDKLANLKSVSLFGFPPPPVINELANLTKLEELTIIQMPGNFANARSKQQIERALPGVTIMYFDESKRKPDTTPEFEEFLKTKSSELKAHLLNTSDGDKD